MCNCLLLWINKMAATAALVLLICINYGAGYSLMEEFGGPIWPEEFHLKAEKIDLEAGIVETMELWSSATYNRSRMDFYNDMVTQYYYWGTEDQSGYLYNFVPQSTEEYQNKIICMQKILEDKDEPYNHLPQVEHYKFVGEEELEGRVVEVWKYEIVKDKLKLVDRTLYTYPSGNYDVPVRSVAKNFLTTNGAMTSHVITNYYNYNSTVEEEDLDAGDTDDCHYFFTRGEDFHNDIKHLHPAKESDVDAAFHSYKKHHGKYYDSDSSEHELRKAIFHENWQMVVNHNRQNHGYKMALNQFADYTSDELEGFTGLLPSPPATVTHPFPHSDEEVRKLAEELPETYDMRVEGFISPVKNQAHCGSCWAFSTTAAVEGALTRSNGGRMVDLSEQSMVDCAWEWGCMGCNGGIMELALRYIMKHGIPMEYDYGSYLEQDGLCHIKNMTTTFTIKGFGKSTPYNAQALKVTLHKYGPVVVGIRFGKKMRFYSSGVFYDTECNKKHPNHGVVVVGYGVQNGVDYWIIKNSHGSKWGQAGYLYISAANNNCFVLSEPIYPIV